MARVLRGTGIVPGIVVGVLHFCSADQRIETGNYQVDPPDVEQLKVLQAMADVRQDVHGLMDQAQAIHQTTQKDILEAQLMMLQDPELISAVVEEIAGGQSAPQAVENCCTRYAVMIENCGDDYLAQRSADIRDVGNRIRNKLLRMEWKLTSQDQDIILCAQDLAPSLIASLPTDQVKGIVLAKGGAQSHAMIIAQSKQLPAMIGVNELFSVTDGMTAVLDADHGRLIVNPSEQERSQLVQRAEQRAGQMQQQLLHCQEPASTVDGIKITVAANIAVPQEAEQAYHYGADGIGLFRSEFLFFDRSGAPTEDEQFEAYKRAVLQCPNRQCTIRTLDVGGDKPLPYLQFPVEQNPFLGCRGIRVSLREPQLFVTQLKAILRAAAFGKIAIMLPMVISAAEVRLSRKYLDQAEMELQQQGIPYADASLGIMVETPAAAIQADLLAQECDFFSIGTNDLTQYTLATDRGNHQLQQLYDYFHPAVLALIRDTVQSAHRHGIQVSVCGTMAADALAVPLLIGLGVNELSVTPGNVPAIKHQLRSLAREQVQSLAEQACRADGPERVRMLVTALTTD